jgi:hypothetical protein
MTIVCVISHIGIALHHCTDWPSGFSYQSLQILRRGSPTNWCTVIPCLLSIHNDHFMYCKPDFSPKYTSQGSDYRPIHINPYLCHALYNIVCGCGNKRSIIIIIINLELLNLNIFSQCRTSLCLAKSGVRYHTGGSMKLNAHILHLAHMVYL